MAEELCYCGLRLIETDHASFEVGGAACCTRQCYNDAVGASQPLDRDGFLWGGPRDPVVKPLN
jgi:hypothetical protein